MREKLAGGDETGGFGVLLSCVNVERSMRCGNCEVDFERIVGNLRLGLCKEWLGGEFCG
jgi:hypothetical protein